jgi:hypothetical protein
MFSDTRCLVSIITLVIIPLTYGQTGDFVMRASLGPLFVLMFASIRALLADMASADRAANARPMGLAHRRLVHFFALVLCAPTAISEAVYLRTAGRFHQQFVSMDPMRAGRPSDFSWTDRVTAVQFFDLGEWKYRPQYFTVQQPSVIRPVLSPPMAREPADTPPTRVGGFSSHPGARPAHP